MPRKKLTRRSMLKKAGLVSAGVAVTFMGPWHFNRVYAATSDKPIVIGLTSDAEDRKNNLPICVAGGESVWPQVGR